MIWLIGNKGMLGQELEKLLVGMNLSVCGTDRDVDILSSEALEKQYEKCKPGWIVNCSAYTAVDKAEEDSENAYRLNRDGVANIAQLAKKYDLPLIHISTDYVFDGNSATAIDETTATAPIGVYGASKLAGEEAIREKTDKHFIIRTAWLYGEYGNNFVYTMLRLMNSKPAIKVVDDQRGTPTWAKDLAGLIGTIIQSGSNEYGLYHFSGEGACTWYDFAREIYRQGREKGLIQNECTISPCTSDEYPTAAKRPAYSLLLKEKVKKNIMPYIPQWEESLEQFLEGIENE